METIRVTSHLDETLKGRFDGKDYIFVPGKATLMSLDAATHIFALGEEDKSGALNKLGLLTPGRNSYQEALEKLDSITFDQGRVTFDADPSEEEDTEPGETGEGARTRKRTGGRRPHVDPSGEPGAPSGAPADSN
jgi:hypothetical protein